MGLQMPLIEVKYLEKVYENEGTETPALRGVSFSVEKGEFAAIMGASGSGKSTLLHILGFLDKPTSGEYIFGGKKMNDFSEEEIAELRNKNFGFVFQSFYLLPKMTVLENVMLPLIYSEVAESEWETLAQKAVDAVGLAHRAHHDSAKLSGGEKQRVAIARALVNDPQLIFADEPTGNLDSKSGQVVMEIIQRLSEKEGKTVILITHETYTAARAERIIRIKDGEVESDEKINHN